MVRTLVYERQMCTGGRSRGLPTLDMNCGGRELGVERPAIERSTPVAIMSPVPPATVVRRRRAAVLAAAGAAFVLGASLGAGDENEDAPSRPRPRPTPPAPAATAPRPPPPPSPTRSKASRSSSRSASSSCCASRAPPPRPTCAASCATAGRRARSCSRPTSRRPPQLRALTRASCAAGKAGGATPIVCTDQEGGVIRNVAWAPPARRAGRPAPRAGRPRRGAGAAQGGHQRHARARSPTCRRAPAPRSPRARSRATRRQAATATKAAVEGWRAGGVAATAKHFPGLGGATVNTDHGSATIRGGAPTRVDLAPFRAAIAAKRPADHELARASIRGSTAPASPPSRRRSSRTSCAATSATRAS